MLDINKIRSKKEELERKERERRDRFYKLKEGDNIFRFLPIGDLFYKEVYRHRIGENDVICPKTFSPDKPCPICELVDKLRQSGDIAQAIQYLPRVRYYSVVVRKNENGEEVVSIVGYGNQVWMALSSLVLDPEWGDFTDPKNGYSINIKRIGEGRNTKYQVIPRKKASVPKQKYDEWLSKMPNLDAIFKEPSYQSLVEALQGVGEFEYLEEGTEEEIEL